MAYPDSKVVCSSCCVVGSTQLAINCSLILLKNGFSIKHIFTNDEVFSNWADELSISHNSIEVMKNFTLISTCGDLDYLFSIVNDTLVPVSVLKAVKKLSINYHNGPLPRYAGTNAMNWAIINGERNHGICWHVMTEQFDSGVVLAREEVRIEEHDSLFDVNWKCMQAAEKSLHILCEALNKGMHIEQPRCSLMYFGLEKKPTPFCLLPLNHSAKQVYNFFRGCFHLPSGVNELGLPKLYLPTPYNKLVIVSNMDVYRGNIYKTYAAGCVVAVREALIVAVGGNTYIEIKELMELDGSNIEKPFNSHFPSLCDMNLMVSECGYDESYMGVSKVTGKNDRRWSRYMTKMKREIQNKGVIALGWPYYSTFVPSLTESNFTSASVCSFPVEVVHILKRHFPTYDIELVSLASFVTFLLALSPSASPGYCDVIVNNLPSHCQDFLLNYIPVLLKYSQDSTLLELIETNCKSLAKVTCSEFAEDEEKQKFWISSDIYLRYPIECLRTSLTLALMSDINKLSGKMSQNLTITCAQQQTVTLTAWFSKNNFHPSSFHTVEDDFLCFLYACFEQPGRCIGSLPVCNVETQEFLLSCLTLNGPVSQIYGSTLHEPFLKLAKECPHKIAIIDEYGQYTYHELKQRANEIALAIGNPRRVALLLERSWEFIASMMAVLMAGASFIPIEPSFPLKYIQYVIDNSESEVVIADKITPKLQKVVCKQHIYLNLIPESSNVLLEEINCVSNQEAAILYTSGTTGQPKGVLLTHLGLINVLESVMKSIDLYKNEIPNDYVLHSSSTTFDSFFLETFPPLWTGATVIIHPTNPLEETRCSSFLKYVNFLHTQPVKLSFFKPSSFVSINRLTFGGEAPTINLLQPWLQICKNSWNIYGPTETSVITTAALISDSIHLGKCIQNAQLRVLTPSMQIAPQGVSGELHIGGIGVALGYTDCAQTEKSFWKDETNKTFYRTGDLVYVDHEEVLNFIGRLPKDRQVKVGGVRIELSGIEHVIQQQKGVKFAKVVKEVQNNRNDILVAYVCPENVDCQSIQSYLSKVLPIHTIPTIIIPLHEEDIKFSSSGKLRWKTKYKAYLGSKNIHAPSTKLERRVLNLYRQCLGLEDSEIFGLHGQQNN